MDPSVQAYHVLAALPRKALSTLTNRVPSSSSQEDVVYSPSKPEPAFKSTRLLHAGKFTDVYLARDLQTKYVAEGR